MSKVSPFPPRVLIVNHKRRHRFISIAKVGCTTLKFVTAVDDGLRGITAADKPQKAHEALGYQPDGKALVPVGSDAFSDYKTVAVWRDPVGRFMSWYQDKVLHPNMPYIRYLGLSNEPSIDRCLEFLGFELGKSSPEWMDEHVRPQHHYYDLHSVDLVVMLRDMSSYLRSLGIERTEQTNKTKASDWPSDAQEQRIRELYRGDYELLERVKGKVWEPEMVADQDA